MTKLMFASDLHGDLASTEAILDRFSAEGAERLILLGDLLYHGPRNPLPPTYSPAEVLKLLNRVGERILAVRGNCDADVDQMVLSFPMMAEFGWICADGRVLYLTHGHRFNRENPPSIAPGDCLLQGHTHIPEMTAFGKNSLLLNPGSAAIPKNGTPRGYLILENGLFSFRDLSGVEYLRERQGNA